MTKTRSGVYKEDKSAVPHGLAAEEIAELKALLKEAEDVIKTINSPLQTVLQGGMLYYFVKYAGFSFMKSINILAKEINKIEKSDTPYAEELATLCAILLFSTIGYSIYRTMGFLDKNIARLFPRGITSPLERQEHPALEKVRALLQGEKIAESGLELIAELDKLLGQELLPKSHKITGLTMLVSICSSIIPGAPFFVKNKNNYKMVRALIARQLYISRRGVMRFINKIRYKINQKKYDNALSDYAKQLNELTFCNKWQYKNNDMGEARFCLRLDSSKEEFITIYVKEGVNEVVLSLPTRVYIKELSEILKKEKMTILSEGPGVILIKKEDISKNKAKKIKHSLMLRLTKRYEMENHKNTKQDQLNTLKNAVSSNKSWYIFPVRDASGLPDLNYMISDNAIPEIYCDYFMSTLCVLFGNDAVKREDGSIVVKGYLSANESFDEEFEKLKQNICEINSKHMKPAVGPDKSAQDESKEKNQTVFQPVRVGRRNKESKATGSMSKASVESKKASNETAADSCEKIKATLKTAFKLKEAESDIYPLNTSWTSGKFIYFAVIDESVKEEIGPAILKQFISYLNNYTEVGPSGGSGVGVFSTNESYNGCNGSKSALFKLKTAQNARLFGTLAAKKDSMSLIKFDGFTLRAH